MANQRNWKLKLNTGDLIYFLHFQGIDDDIFYDYLEDHFGSENCIKLQPDIRTPEAYDQLQVDFSDMRVVQANLDYNFYYYLPRTPIYMTFLMNPVNRIVQFYENAIKNSQHPLYNELHKQNISLYDFVCDPQYAIYIENVQAKRIAGSMFEQELTDDILLEIAKVNLDEMIFFGIFEQCKLSLDLFLYTLNFAEKPSIPLDKKRKNIIKREISPSTLDAIEQRTQIDAQLYQYAKQTLQERLAILK